MLGAVLGLGFLAKAPMLPLSAVFIMAALFAAGSIRKSAARLPFVLVTFALVVAPFILTLSHNQGRFTWGDSWRLNYAWYVNHVPRYHWQGSPAQYGTPVHPTQKLSEAPAVYAFDNNSTASYAIWNDPAYWNRGLRLVVDLKSMLKQVFSSGLLYYDVFLHQQAGVASICLLLFFVGARGKSCLTDLARYWQLFLPALAAFGLYAPVHVEERMIAAFSVLLWLGLFAAVRVQNKFEIRRVSSCAAAAVAVFVIFSLANSVLGEAASHGGAELKSWNDPKANPQWQVAEELHRAGVHATDKVAWIRPAAFDPSKQNYGWARLARVRIIAEIPSSEADTFWSADSGQRSAVFNALARTGAVALVVTKMPATV